MSRPYDQVLFVFECPYCHEKSKRIDRVPLRHLSKVESISTLFSVCPSCNWGIVYHLQKPQKPYQSWEARLVEYVERYQPTDTFDPMFLSLPTLPMATPRNILLSNRYKPDIEYLIRKELWLDYSHALIFSNYISSHLLKRISKWSVVKERVKKSLQRLSNMWVKEDAGPDAVTEIPVESLDIHKIESAFAFWKVNQCTDDFYKNFESVIITEAEKLLKIIRSAATEKSKMKSLYGHIREFYDVSEFTLKIQSSRSRTEYGKAYKDDPSISLSAYQKVDSLIKKTQGEFQSLMANLINALGHPQPSIDKLSNVINTRKIENNFNLERLLQFELSDQDRLEIFQHLGRFNEASELLKNIEATTSTESQSAFHSIYYKEMRKRIHQRNQRPFLVEYTYVVVNKTRESKSNLKRMLSVNPSVFYEIMIYQQLGRFKEAEELLNGWFGTKMMSNSSSDFDLAFNEEMGRRIKGKIKKPFTLQKSFVIVDAK